MATVTINKSFIAIKTVEEIAEGKFRQHSVHHRQLRDMMNKGAKLIEETLAPLTIKPEFRIVTAFEDDAFKTEFVEALEVEDFDTAFDALKAAYDEEDATNEGLYEASVTFANAVIEDDDTLASFYRMIEDSLEDQEKCNKMLSIFRFLLVSAIRHATGQEEGDDDEYFSVEALADGLESSKLSLKPKQEETDEADKKKRFRKPSPTMYVRVLKWVFTCGNLLKYVTKDVTDSFRQGEGDKPAPLVNRWTLVELCTVYPLFGLGDIGEKPEVPEGSKPLGLTPAEEKAWKASHTPATSSAAPSTSGASESSRGSNNKRSKPNGKAKANGPKTNANGPKPKGKGKPRKGQPKKTDGDDAPQDGATKTKKPKQRKAKKPAAPKADE